MTKRRDELAKALQANRDLQNKIHQIEHPLQVRIRELEVERDRYAALVKEDGDKIAVMDRGLKAALTLVEYLLSTGKVR